MKPENEQIYVKLFIRTILLSIAITLSCVLLGVSDCLSAGEPADQNLQYAADSGIAAVLDLAAGSNIGVEGAVAATGGDQ